LAKPPLPQVSSRRPESRRELTGRKKLLSYQGAPDAANVPARSADYAYCEDLVRRMDRDRWLASLFVPQDRRRHIHAVYAFNCEMARVNELVSEPLLGEIRFQWWREALEGANQGDALANPVSAALLDTMARFDLPTRTLLELIGARTGELYGERLASLAALGAYLQATCAHLFRLAALIVDRERAAAGLEASQSAGFAYGLAGLMRALPWLRAQGALFVPSELLQARGVALDEFAAGRASPAVRAALADMRALARRHLDQFTAGLDSLPDKCKPAFLPACLCEPYLQLMEGRGYDPFKTIIELPQWRRQWIIWRAARRWG
jgi:15-cis-phytoene synthase